MNRSINDCPSAERRKTAKSFSPRPPMPWFNVHAVTDADLRAFAEPSK